ncbi:hypothetical protein B0H11DRAFT_2198932, partial [Mycena galericulata]
MYQVPCESLYLCNIHLLAVVFRRWSNSSFSQLSLYTASTLSFQPASVGAREYPVICIQKRTAAQLPVFSPQQFATNARAGIHGVAAVASEEEESSGCGSRPRARRQGGGVGVMGRRRRKGRGVEPASGEGREERREGGGAGTKCNINSNTICFSNTFRCR